MIETVLYWATKPRTLSRNTLDLLQDEHSKTGEPLRVIMHAWGSPATGANPFVSSSYFPSFGVVWEEKRRRYRGKPFAIKIPTALCVCVSHLSCSVQSLDRTSLHSPTQGAGDTALASV
jgi:hypothetical protein